MCKACVGSADVEFQYAAVAEESREFEATLREEQKVDGSEPALQLLVLPRHDGSEWPAYGARPEYLKPAHCRICLMEFPGSSESVCHRRSQENVESDEGIAEDMGDDILEAEQSSRRGAAPTAFEAWLKKHLQDCHGMTPESYRREVLGRCVAEWPQPVTAQVLRSRLAAFKEELCDANYRLRACACCAREKRQAKLVEVIFPTARGSPVPTWLKWTQTQWDKFSKTWFDQMDNILNVNQYLERFFFVGARVAQAELEFETALDAERSSTGPSENSGVT